MVSLFLFFFLPFYSVFSLDSPPSLLAVLLENFSIFYNDDDTKLSLSVIKDFKRKWRYFDTQAKVHSPSNNNHQLLDNFQGHIKLSRIKLLLRTLELQDFYSYNLGDPNQSIVRINIVLNSVHACIYTHTNHVPDPYISDQVIIHSITALCALYQLGEFSA